MSDIVGIEVGSVGGVKEEKALKITGIIIILSTVSTVSLAINSLMQETFKHIVSKPKNKIIANLIWVLFLIGLTIFLVLFVFKGKVDGTPFGNL